MTLIRIQVREKPTVNSIIPGCSGYKPCNHPYPFLFSKTLYPISEEIILALSSKYIHFIGCLFALLMVFFFFLYKRFLVCLSLICLFLLLCPLSEETDASKEKKKCCWDWCLRAYCLFFPSKTLWFLVLHLSFNSFLIYFYIWCEKNVLVSLFYVL